MRWLIALMLPQSPAYALDMGTAPQAVSAYTSAYTEVAPAAQVTKLAALPPPTTGEPGDEPFGALSTIAITSGELLHKWKAVSREIESEAAILAICAARQECPAAARKLLEIVAEGREHSGLARVGVINRAINLSIAPTSDMKQWGVPDRWSSPLETLTTGRGDCEDYAIAKYVALLDAGLPPGDVKLVIVHDRALDEDHAIVAAHAGGNWIVLDNRRLALVRAVELTHTTPLFVIDYSGVKAFAPQGGSTRLAALVSGKSSVEQ